MRHPLLAALTTAAAPALLLVACASAPAAPPSAAVPSAAPEQSCVAPTSVPAGRALFGVNLDWGTDTVADYSDRLGHVPASAVSFAAFPLDDVQRGHVDEAVDQVAAVGASLMLTVEPHGGLDTVTDDHVTALVTALVSYNERGVPVFLRFAHEMNGSWYAWGQQPEQYREVFARVARAVRAATDETFMVWAPNYGGGYPFAGGEFGAGPGSAAHDLLDTDGDGVLTMSDDPYAPYYPGNEAVDWVGMSVYHWGEQYPWGENEVPAPGKFAALLTGDYPGEEEVPDFYAEYAEGTGKPLSVTETAALYAPGAGGASEREIKQAWWEQVLDPAVYEGLPALAAVNWFEWDKQEAEVGGRVDWGVTRSPDLVADFSASLPDALVYGGCVTGSP